MVFSDARFKGGAQVSRAHFQEIVFSSRAKFEGKEADFNNSEFYSKTHFSGHFNGKTKFNYVLYEGKDKVIFDIENLSDVSFMNTDIQELDLAIRQDREMLNMINSGEERRLKKINSR